MLRVVMRVVGCGGCAEGVVRIGVRWDVVETDLGFVGASGVFEDEL
jgi:hypothetical protein